MRRDAVGEKNIRADGRMGANYRVAAHDSGAGVDSDMILDRWMTFLTSQSPSR